MKIANVVKTVSSLFDAKKGVVRADDASDSAAPSALAAEVAGQSPAHSAEHRIQSEAAGM